MAVDLGAVFGKFEWRIGGADAVKQQIEGVGQAADATGKRAEGAFSGLPKVFFGVSSGINGIVSSLGAIGLAANGIKAIGDAFSGTIGGLTSANAEFERYRTQLTVLTKDAGAAEARLAELTEFGQKTPFVLPQVIQAEKVLMSFGLTADQATQRFGMSAAQIRTVVGDTASGVGVDFQEMAGLIGRFSAGATGEALMRFQELGVGTKAELQSMGLAFDNAGAMTTPLDQAMGILLTNLQSKFGGMMATQARTFEGMQTDLSDWWWNTQRIVSEPIFDSAKEGLESLLQLLKGPTMQSATTNFAAGLGVAVEGLSGLVRSGVEAVGSFQGAFGAGLAATANSALEWGINIVASLADGLITGASSLLTGAMDSISGLLDFFLAPGSPPRVAPDLPDWGAAAMDTWLQGFSEADFGTLEGLAGPLRQALDLAFGGDKEGAASAYQSLLQQMTQSIADTGGISSELLAQIQSQTGPYGDMLVALAQKQAALTAPTEALTAAQDKLNAAREEEQRYRDSMDAERQKLADMRKADSRAIEDMRRAGATKEQIDAAKIEADLRQRTQEDLIDNMDTEMRARSASVRAAQEQVTTARAALDAAQKEADLQEKRLQTLMGAGQEHNRQLDAMERMAQAAERTARAQESLGRRATTSANDAEGAELKYRLAVASTSEKIAILREELGKTTEGSAEYYNILTQIAGLEKQGAGKGEGLGASLFIKPTFIGDAADKLAKAGDDVIALAKAKIKARLFGAEVLSPEGDVVGRAGGMLTPLLLTFDKLKTTLDQVKGAWDRLTTAAQPLVTALGPVGQFIANPAFIQNFGQVGGIAAAAAIGIGLFSVAVGALTSPIGLLVLAVAAIAALKTAWDSNLGGIRDNVTAYLAPIKADFALLVSTFNWVGEQFAAWGGVFSAGWASAKGWTTQAGADIRGAITDTGNAIAGWFTERFALWQTSWQLGWTNATTWVTNFATSVSLSWSTLTTAISNLWTYTLVPMFTTMGIWYQYLVQFVANFGLQAGTAWNTLINAISGLWYNTLLPVFTTLADWYNNLLTVAVNTWADLIGTRWNDIKTAIVDTWTLYIQPALQAMWNLMSGFATFLSTTFEKALWAINSVLSAVKSAVEGLKESLRDLDVPSWLRPGSPTPFELGLRGIAAALPDVQRGLAGVNDIMGSLNAPTLAVAPVNLAAAASANLPAAQGAQAAAMGGGEVSINVSAPVIFNGPINATNPQDFVQQVSSGLQETLSQRLADLAQPLRDMGKLASIKGMRP